MDKIEKVIYINLAHRTDRRQQIEGELSVFPPEKVIRFDAIKNENGLIGCVMSHIAVLEMAMHEGWKNYLVVEDDMIWKNYHNGIEILNRLINSKYDVIMLGGYYVNYNKQTYKLISGQTTTSFIVNQSYYITLLNNFKEGLNKLQETNNSREYALDQYWKRLQAKDDWYNIELCIQRPSYSDIEKKLVNYQQKKTILDFLKGKK